MFLSTLGPCLCLDDDIKFTQLPINNGPKGKFAMAKCLGIICYEGKNGAVFIVGKCGAMSINMTNQIL